MAEKKNNPTIAVVLVAALLGAAYLVFTGFGDDEPKRKTLEYNGTQNSSDDNDSVSSFVVAEMEEGEGNAQDKGEGEELPMPSMQELETSVQLTIKRIDANLDKAFNLQYGPKRGKLLKETKKSLDSMLAMGDNPFYHISYGDLEMLRGSYKESERHYSIALKVLTKLDGLKRNHAQACFNASLASVKENDTDAAIAYLEKFRAFEDADEEANQLLYSWYKARSIGLMWEGKTRLGRKLLQKALAMNEYDNAVQFNMGIAQYRLLEYDKAIKHFEYCLELDKNHVPSKDYLYTIYRIKGDTATANKYRTQAQDIVLPPIERDR